MVLEDNRLKNKESKVWLENDGIARVRIGKGINIDILKVLSNDCREITKNPSFKSKLIINLTRSRRISKAAFRRASVVILRDLYRDIKFEKLAVWGGNIFIKTIALFIINAARIKNIEYFKSEEEALKWLKEE